MSFERQTTRCSGKRRCGRAAVGVGECGYAHGDSLADVHAPGARVWAVEGRSVAIPHRDTSASRRCQIWRRIRDQHRDHTSEAFLCRYGGCDNGAMRPRACLRASATSVHLSRFSDVLRLLVRARRSEFAKDIELLVLRHQLTVLGRREQARCSSQLIVRCLRRSRACCRLDPGLSIGGREIAALLSASGAFPTPPYRSPPVAVRSPFGHRRPTSADKKDGSALESKPTSLANRC